VPTYRGFSVLILINMPVAEVLHHDKVIEDFARGDFRESPWCRSTTRCGGGLMYKLFGCAAAALIWSASFLVAPVQAAPHGGGPGGGHGFAGGGHPGGGGFGGFHGGGGFRGGGFGRRGFSGGGFIGGYDPGYEAGFYPYPDYEDLEPVCDFVWVRRVVRHKTVRRRIYSCN
jgi:hypothetical protein